MATLTKRQRDYMAEARTSKVCILPNGTRSRWAPGAPTSGARWATARSLVKLGLMEMILSVHGRVIVGHALTKAGLHELKGHVCSTCHGMGSTPYNIGTQPCDECDETGYTGSRAAPVDNYPEDQMVAR